MASPLSITTYIPTTVLQTIFYFSVIITSNFIKVWGKEDYYHSFFILLPNIPFFISECYITAPAPTLLAINAATIKRYHDGGYEYFGTMMMILLSSILIFVLHNLAICFYKGWDERMNFFSIFYCYHELHRRKGADIHK